MKPLYEKLLRYYGKHTALARAIVNEDWEDVDELDPLRLSGIDDIENQEQWIKLYQFMNEKKKTSEKRSIDL